MLRIEGLDWSAGGTPILQTVELELAEGEVCALLGPSGSGKSSLLRLIMGLATPTHGRIHLDEHLLAEDGHDLVPAEQRPCAFLFQHFTLLPHLDVRGNILIALGDLPRAERRERLEQATALLSLEPLLRRSVHSLSGGEQQRVALARTLCRRPRLLLLDEPFSNLDQMRKEELYHELRELLRRFGIAALLATHDRHEAALFANRWLLIDHGHIVADDHPETLYRHPPSRWAARFTGTVNLLDARQLARLFPDLPPYDDNETLLLRPEQVLLQPGDQASIEELRHLGATSQAHIRCQSGPAIVATLLSPHDWQPGARVSLALRGAPWRLPT